MLRHVIAASAILIGTSFGAAALPAATGLATPAVEAPILEVKNRKHRHHHGWGHHRGPHHGWHRGHHRGWHKHHRRHHGWHRHHRGHGWY